ncbi:hypothetical protein [Spirochaeta lutea]|uniref:ABC-2 type transporter domain-containing protein n=1 Tax=Spirochaeta lutea TaxID=1480694 RepID=A0A098QU74_9SPIO|nr:hypothetical protein [Spirochaeta lutea]KGE70938.1 hypothetical protein DC28_13425 [Spirochaeta lutea]
MNHLGNREDGLSRAPGPWLDRPFWKLFGMELQVLWKNGLPQVYGVVAAMMVGILSLMPASAQAYVLPVFLFMDPATLGMFFIPSQLLLLKDSRVLATYLFLPRDVRVIFRAKILVYTLLSVGSSLVIGVLGGWPVQTLVVLPWLLGVNWLLTILGVAIGLRIRSLNQLFLILPLVLIALISGLLYLLPGAGSEWWLLHPFRGFSYPFMAPWLGAQALDLGISFGWTTAVGGLILGFYSRTWKHLLSQAGRGALHE